MAKWENNVAVKNFREYLRIPTVHPDVDYDGCVDFLLKQAESLQLEARVVEVASRKPVVVMTWRGEQPDLPAVMLNSHMDVVPVYEEFWTHPPFDAHLTEDGWIYARGTQDMKSVGIQHIEAVRRLKESGVRLKRTVHITFLPDEEIGSVQGMRQFVETKEFQELNLGVSLDESMPTDQDDVIIMFYGERITYRARNTSEQMNLRLHVAYLLNDTEDCRSCPSGVLPGCSGIRRQCLEFKVKCTALPGHGSMLPANTAGEKLQYIINKFMDFRAQEKKRFDDGEWLGNVTTVNLTQTIGGVQANVLPESLSVVFDVRFAPDIDHVEFENNVHKWCKEAGDGVTFEYVQKNPIIKSTVLEDSNVFWTAIRDANQAMGIDLKTLICPGATDARFVRSKGIPSFGFSPLINTPQLLHAHDERLHADVFLRGIDIMKKVVQAIANA